MIWVEAALVEMELFKQKQLFVDYFIEELLVDYAGKTL